MSNSFVYGKKALVIGGTSGIGFCLADILAQKGALVSVFEANGLCEFEHEAFKQILTECSVLCVCYGPFVQKKLHETSPEDWQKMALLDYALPGVVVSKVLTPMSERKCGSILLFGGTRSEVPRACSTNAAYLGAKTGLGVIVKSVARE